MCKGQGRTAAQMCKQNGCSCDHKSVSSQARWKVVDWREDVPVRSFPDNYAAEWRRRSLVERSTSQCYQQLTRRLASHQRKLVQTRRSGGGRPRTKDPQCVSKGRLNSEQSWLGDGGSSCNANWCRAPGVTAGLPATLTPVVHYISRFGSQLVLRWQVLSPDVTSHSLVACYNNGSCVLSVTTRDLGYCHSKRSCVLRAITPNLASCDCVYQVRKGQEIVYATDTRLILIRDWYCIVYTRLFIFIFCFVCVFTHINTVNIIVVMQCELISITFTTYTPLFKIILLCKVSCVWKCNDLVLPFHYDSEHKPPKSM